MERLVNQNAGIPPSTYEVVCWCLLRWEQESISPNYCVYNLEHSRMNEFRSGCGDWDLPFRLEHYQAEPACLGLFWCSDLQQTKYAIVFWKPCRCMSQRDERTIYLLRTTTGACCPPYMMAFVKKVRGSIQSLQIDAMCYYIEAFCNKLSVRLTTIWEEKLLMEPLLDAIGHSRDFSSGYRCW